MPFQTNNLDINISLPSPSVNTFKIDSIKSFYFNHTSSIKIIYMNARSVLSKIDELQFILSNMKTKIDIIAITETWLTTDKTKYFNIKGYTSVFSCRGDGYGGSAILVHNSHKFVNLNNSNHLIDIPDKINIASIKLECQNCNMYSDVYISCIYRAPSANVNEFFNVFESLLSGADHNHSIVMGDMNIDSNTDNHKVQDYLNLITSTGCFLVNSRPTRNNSCIDHCVVNNSNQTIQVNHYVMDKFDHDVLFYEFSTPHNYSNIVNKDIIIPN